MQITKPKILFITLFMSLFALFIYRKKRAHINDWEKKEEEKNDEQYILNKPKVA